ncbi:MAG TPA: hypothetical protein VKZ98_03135 [Aquaticitalea sp.]|nr:hypothetical protein [Aquaticitalea sp.]
MKNLLMIALAFVTLNAVAQEDKKEMRKTEMKERMAKSERMTPEEIATLQTKKMTLHLDLNEKQQSEVKALLLEEAQTRKDKMAAFKAKKETGEKPSKDDRFNHQNDRLDHQIELKKKMKTILNADQYAKYEQIHTTMHNKKRKMSHKRKTKE